MNLFGGNDDVKLEDEEFHMSLVQRLPVSTFDQYDPSIPPQNGADYLRRVQLEARKEPNIKVAEELCSKSSYHESYNLESIKESEFIKSLPEFIIPEEIISLVIESFQKLRQHIEDLRMRNKDLEKPKKRTQKWWQQYCFCEPRAENQMKFLNFQPEIVYQTNLPRLTILSRISQQEICRLLNYHYEWMKGDDDDHQFTIEQGLWIYFLLAGLNSIQPDDTYCLLRQISRLCSQIRNKLELDFDNGNNNNNNGSLDDTQCSMLDKLASLNLIILLVGYYFKQKDLLDSWCVEKQ